jgi:hypothetical protein
MGRRPYAIWKRRYVSLVSNSRAPILSQSGGETPNQPLAIDCSCGNQVKHL